MIAITGASGYVGSHLTKRLAKEGYPVKALVHNRERAEKEARLNGLMSSGLKQMSPNQKSLHNALRCRCSDSYCCHSYRKRQPDL
jgi:nucleoside-diphosphate-sugar epimerase